MNLSAEDTRLYYRLRRSVLAYTNRQLGIIPQAAAPQDIHSLRVAETAKLGAAFYDNAELLDRYLVENPDDFPSGDLAIVASWKGRISGDFHIMRHLKAYSIFMSSKPSHLYGVLGLKDPIRDLMADASLPILVRAVLLPFQDHIIYDGIMSMYRITFGRGIHAGLSRTYSRLKENEGIIEGLFNVKGEEQTRTSLTRKFPAQPVPDWGPAISAILV